MCVARQPPYLKEDERRSTIERDNPLENSEPYEMVVPTQRLDDYDLDAVGFIKIDVEGHGSQS
jgi:hypothetical protein